MSEKIIEVGNRVRLESTGECGIVLHTWRNDVGDVDCYVAFFGDEFPRRDEQLARIPYVLRYGAVSLRFVE